MTSQRKTLEKTKKMMAVLNHIRNGKGISRDAIDELAQAVYLFIREESLTHALGDFAEDLLDLGVKYYSDDMGE